MLKAAALALPLLGVAGTAFAADHRCVVDAVPAFQEAHEAGFDFQALETTGVSCRLFNTTIILTAPANAAAVCRYLVLAGRLPESGWHIRGILLSGNNASVAPNRVEHSRTVDGVEHVSQTIEPGFVVRIAAARGETNTVSVDRLVLLGPDCARFEMAFAP
jgi:hypothetical protein